MFARSIDWIKENKLGLGIIVVTWLIFFSRTLFAGQIYFLDDLKIIYYPLEHVYAQFQANWQLPQWSQYFGFGHPLMAWGQLGFFTPLHVLLRAFHTHPLILLQVSILSYFAFGLIGMFTFLRQRTFSQCAAALGAVVFVFSGFHIGHLNHVNFYTATMLLPWLLLAISYFLEKPSLNKTALLALAAAIIPLSGQPQVSLYILIIAAIAGIMMLLEHKQQFSKAYFVKTISLTAIAAVLFFLLASFAILPLFEFLPLTDRAGDLPISQLFDFSYPPNHLITLLNPYHFGNHSSYWGAKNFQELAAYVGLLPLALAALALFRWKDHRGLRITGLLLIVIAALFATGIHSPLYRFLVEQHIITKLNIPGRFVFFLDVGLAFLAVVGLSDLVLYLHKFSWRKYVALTIVVLAAANLVYWGWNYNPLVDVDLALKTPPFSSNLKEFESTHGYPPRLYSREVIFWDRAPASNLTPTNTIGASLAIYQPLHIQATNDCLSIPMHKREDGSSTAIQLGLHTQLETPAFHSIEIDPSTVSNSRPYRYCLPQVDVNDLWLSFTAEQDSGINLYTVASQRVADNAYIVRVTDPTSDELLRSQKNLKIDLQLEHKQTHDLEAVLLARHVNATANSSSARWIGALAIESFRFVSDKFFASDRDDLVDGEGTHLIENNRYMFDMAGVTHFTQTVSEQIDDKLRSQNLPVVAEEKFDDTTIRLYENPQAFPKAFLVPNAQWQPVTDEVNARLVARGYDPTQLVYLGGETPPQNLDRSTAPATSASVQITKYEPTHVEIQVAANRDAWLVLSDTFTPQWQAFINGEPTQAYSANIAFRAVQIPAGSHTVSWIYQSPAIARSKQLTLIGLAAVLLLLAAPFGRRLLVSPPHRPTNNP